eukprot:9470979-Pyramimonas_sp.AAC.1
MREDVKVARDESGATPEHVQAALEDPDLEIFTRGIFVYPDSELPKPSTSSEVELFDVLGNPLDMDPEQIADLSSDQVLRLVSDGSCSKPPIRALQRAAWAIGVLPDVGAAPEP